MPDNKKIKGIKDIQLFIHGKIRTTKKFIITIEKAEISEMDGKTRQKGVGKRQKLWKAMMNYELKEQFM